MILHLLTSKSKLRTLSKNIALDKGETSFCNMMETLSNSGEVLDPVYGEMLQMALSEEIHFEDVYETIAPIVTEVLSETLQHNRLGDRGVFNGLIREVIKAHERLMQKAALYDSSKLH